MTAERNRSRLSKIAAAIWALLAALLVVGLIGGPAGAVEKDVERVGTLDVSFTGATNPSLASYSLIFNSPARRAYQFFTRDTGETVGRIFDLDRRVRLLEKVFPPEAFASGPQAAPQEWIHALDQVSGTLYMAFRRGGSWGGITALDGKTLAVRKIYERPLVNVQVNTDDPVASACTSSACLPQAPIATPTLKGMSFVPSELTGLPPKLIMISEDLVRPPPLQTNFNVVWLTQWDTVTGRQDYNYRVQACGNHQLPALADTAYQLGVFQARLGAGVYVACAASGGTGQVVKINFDLNGQPSVEQAFPGPQSLADAIPDVESDRMVMRVSNEEGESLWVFDGGALAYTGVVGITSAGANTANGIDPITGRFYTVAPPTSKGTLRSSGGLLMSDVRRSPAPQALAYPEFAASALGAIRVDTHPLTGERFVYFTEQESTTYTILKDNVPITEDPALRDLDRLTVDVEEEPGVTGRTFGGSGHAFGVRALLVGGVHGFPPTGPDLGGVRVGRHGIEVIGTPCGPGDRRILIGYVKDAQLSDNTASATAAVGETDELTRADIGEPVGRCYPSPRDPTANSLGDGTLWGRVVFEVGARFPGQWQQLQETMKEQGFEEFGKYPRPLDADEEDLDGDGQPDGDGINDYDEIVGSQTPFGVTQCAGDEGLQETDLRFRPLKRAEDHKDDLPPKTDARQVIVPGATAAVECLQSQQRVDTVSEVVLSEQQSPAFQNSNVPGVGIIRVGEVLSKVSIYLDPERGLVTRAESAVRDVQIADDVFIDKAFTIGEAWAAGRYGSAGTSFQRAVCGVRTSDQLPKVPIDRPAADVYQENVQADPYYELETEPTPSASADPNTTVDPTPTPSASVNPTGGGRVDKNVFLAGCSDPVTTPQGQIGVLDVINRALGSRGRAYAPEPDGELAQGTPGGYLASVQKDRLDKISSTAVNNDKSDQIPALEIVLFNDDSTEGRGRQIYQLAGVDATVTYGIYLLNPGDDFFDPGCPECDAVLPDVVLPPFGNGGNGGTPPTTSGPPRGQGPITILYEGLNFLLRSPKDMLLAAVVWGVLFAPVQMSARRRALRALR